MDAPTDELVARNLLEQAARLWVETHPDEAVARWEQMIATLDVSFLHVAEAAYDDAVKARVAR